MDCINNNKNRTLNFIGAAMGAALASLCFFPPTSGAASAPIFAEQGKNWTAAERQKFYSQDQGSQIIPLKWMQALKQSSGNPFMADSLGRYGFLPNESSPAPGLPVGFAVNQGHIGMTCAACHTRQIEAGGNFYRIDGGPAFADFQSFAGDLDQTVAAILNDPKAFADFAHAVLGASAAADKQEQLRKEVAAWYLPYHTIMDKGLPKDKPWGPVRADAVGMIFNRVTGLDIGTSPDRIIAGNISTANAPVRYPFIWNAPIQDKTQWPGFSNNGSDLLGLTRNLGEVLGVFAHFQPRKDTWRILGVDYLHTNSANFDGLKKLEDAVKKIGPPQWPWQQGQWAVDKKLAAQGGEIYHSKTKTEDGGCAACHEIRKGKSRGLRQTWATPLCNVGTDVRQFDLLTRKVETGVLAGAQIPFLAKPLQAKDELAVNVLAAAVLGSTLQHESSLLMAMETSAKKEAQHVEKLLGAKKSRKLDEIAAKLHAQQAKLVTASTAELAGVFQALSKKPNNVSEPRECKDDFKTPEPAIGYESRVLQGIWAAAPYLHNGSVPTLADLLRPVAERPVAFKVGNAYDPAKVGLAAEQPNSAFTLQTEDCSDLHSGNSRCGHEYGTKLAPEEKKALLEYLKTL